MFKYVNISTGFTINSEGYIVEDNDKKILHEHGTVIASIISSICKKIEFISVNILSDKLLADGRVLLYVLNKMCSYSPDIIHLSLGTTSKRYIFQMKRIIKKNIKKNTIIVSAANNYGLKSYPSHLKGAVGVKANIGNDDMKIKFKNGFFYAPSIAIDAYKETNISYEKQLKGTSISAAYITGNLALIKSEKDNIKNSDAIRELKNLINGGLSYASK